MNVHQTIQCIHNLNHASIYELLLLRAIFDEADPVQYLEQDLKDLYIYPDRLVNSYCDEWKAFIKRALRHHNIHKSDKTLSVVEGVIAQRIEQKRDWIDRIETIGRQAIAHSLAVENSPNIHRFTHPNVKQLHKLLKL